MNESGIFRKKRYENLTVFRRNALKFGFGLFCEPFSPVSTNRIFFISQKKRLLFQMIENVIRWFNLSPSTLTEPALCSWHDWFHLSMSSSLIHWMMSVSILLKSEKKCFLDKFRHTHGFNENTIVSVWHFR